MKLDADTVRNILLEIEREQTDPGWKLSVGNLEDYNRFYAASKLYEAGLIEAENVPGDDPAGAPDEEYLVITELTCAGHQALESIRDPKAWAAAKAVGAKAGSYTLEILFAAGRAFAEGKLRDFGLDIS